MGFFDALNPDKNKKLKYSARCVMSVSGIVDSLANDEFEPSEFIEKNRFIYALNFFGFNFAVYWVSLKKTEKDVIEIIGHLHHLLVTNNNNIKIRLSDYFYDVNDVKFIEKKFSKSIDDISANYGDLINLSRELRAEEMLKILMNTPSYTNDCKIISIINDKYCGGNDSAGLTLLAYPLIKKAVIESYELFSW